MRELFARVEAAVGRFNRWLAPAAVSANVESPTHQGAAADPVHVAAILGEIEQSSDGSSEEQRGGSTS